MKFYVSALVGVIIKVILQNARYNNKDNIILVFVVFKAHLIHISVSYLTSWMPLGRPRWEVNIKMDIRNACTELIWHRIGEVARA